MIGVGIGGNSDGVSMASGDAYLDNFIVEEGKVLNTYPDFDGDNDVDFVDFAGFASEWMESCCCLCGGAEFTGDGKVDFNDLAVFVAHWLEEVNQPPDGVLIENFDDNFINTSMWTLQEDDPSVTLTETNHRLEFTSTAAPRAEALLISNFGLDADELVEMRIDYYLNHDESGDSGLEFIVASGPSNYIYIYAGLEDGLDYYYWSAVTGDVPDMIGGDVRSGKSGVLYITYDPAVDIVYISGSGYGPSNALASFPNIVSGTWGADYLDIVFGGESLYCNILPGEAYLDNLVVESGTVWGL